MNPVSMMENDRRVLPWHDAVWSRLLRQYRGERTPHALLLSGLPGLGKRVLAERLAAWLLCEQRDALDDACGACSACVRFAAATHADFHLCGLEEDRQSIAIDAIRALAASLQLSSQHGGWKIAVIDPADRMNAHSVNALLKTLEEPAGQALLVLVSTRPSRLPATVRSRCQHVPLARPDTGTAARWLSDRGAGDPERLLALSGGAPLAALALDETHFIESRGALLDTLTGLVNGRLDAATAAAEWSGQPLHRALGWLQTVVHDLVRMKLGGGRDRLVNRDLREGLQSLSHQLDLLALFHYLDTLLRIQAVADTAVNPQLQLEGVLVPWCDGLDKAA